LIFLPLPQFKIIDFGVAKFSAKLAAAAGGSEAQEVVERLQEKFGQRERIRFGNDHSPASIEFEPSDVTKDQSRTSKLRRWLNLPGKSRVSRGRGGGGGGGTWWMLADACFVPCCVRKGGTERAATAWQWALRSLKWKTCCQAVCAVCARPAVRPSPLVADVRSLPSICRFLCVPADHCDCEARLEARQGAHLRRLLRRRPWRRPWRPCLASPFLQRWRRCCRG
jgi:hypothetical protein